MRLTHCAATWRPLWIFLAICLIQALGAPALSAEPSSASPSNNEAPRASSPPYQWFLWAEDLERGRALLQVDDRAPNRWLWRLSTEESKELELCIFSNEQYRVERLEQVSLAWPKMSGELSSKALLCAKPDAKGVVELKVKPFKIKTPAAKTKRRAAKTSTVARVLTRLSDEEVEALNVSEGLGLRASSKYAQWWLIEAPPAEELKGALFMLEFTSPTERVFISDFSDYELNLPFELGGAKVDRELIIVNSEAFALEDHTRSPPLIIEPSTWSYAKQLSPEELVWMFGGLKEGIALWSSLVNHSELVFERYIKQSRPLQMTRLDGEPLFIGDRAPELYSSGSSVGLKVEPARGAAKQEERAKRSCGSAGAATPMMLGWIGLWFLVVSGGRWRRTRRRLMWAATSCALFFGAAPAAHADDTLKICSARTRVFWDGGWHQQQQHWRALCVQDEATLPEDYHLVIALPPAVIELGGPPKGGEPKKMSLTEVKGEPSAIWELELEQHQGKPRHTREYVMVGYKVYQSAYHVDACQLAKNQHIEGLAEELEALKPLCKRGWLVLIAYLRLKPKAATQTRRPATRGEPLIYEGVVAYLPSLRLDWHHAKSISVELGVSAPDGVARFELKAPWPLEPKALGDCYTQLSRAIEPHLTYGKVWSRTYKEIRSRFMFTQRYQLSAKARCTRDKLTLKLIAP